MVPSAGAGVGTGLGGGQPRLCPPLPVLGFLFRTRKPLGAQRRAARPPRPCRDRAHGERRCRPWPPSGAPTIPAPDRQRGPRVERPVRPQAEGAEPRGLSHPLRSPPGATWRGRPGPRRPHSFVCGQGDPRPRRPRGGALPSRGQDRARAVGGRAAPGSPERPPGHAGPGRPERSVGAAAPLRAPRTAAGQAECARASPSAPAALRPLIGAGGRALGQWARAEAARVLRAPAAVCGRAPRPVATAPAPRAGPAHRSGSRPPRGPPRALKQRRRPRLAAAEPWGTLEAVAGREESAGHRA